ncbi:MAG: sensor histidine kinase [Vicinamibacteria bacterium]
MATKQPSPAELAAELAQKSAEVSILRQVSSDINATLGLEEIYEVVLRTMDELFGFHHALILLLDDDGQTLTVVASRGYEGQMLGGVVPMGTGLIGVVAKKRRLMRLSNLGRQRSYIAAIRKQMEEAGRSAELEDVPPVPGLPDVESQIGIPLLIKDNLIGVFSIETAEQKMFSDRDETLVNIVANQAASAIHNARLYRAEEQRRAELAELNETLEDRVRARTAELERANREIRETQAQLVQSGKMASLGMLVAGVAHEINTPIASIAANSDIVKRAAEMVKQRIEAADVPADLAKDPNLRLAIETLQQASETELLACQRITSIVRSLRNFARLDESEEKSVDLHEGIDSTLTLLVHELKKGVEVVKNYGDLPNVVCFPSQLNQVFMNLLRNAIFAIEGKGTITITTERDGEHVVLRFADTGAGIAPENLERIFDPGFTTKGVGVGTGLGLPICYRIVQDHHGTIGVRSEVGKGTEFTVRLPTSR